MSSMETTIRGNRRRISSEVSQTVVKLPADHRRQMQAIANHRRWPESEAVRDAIRMYLNENKDLLRLIASQNGHGDE
jgi:metal-responsive CopG/Arc/MetJ family transcriptional regulator